MMPHKKQLSVKAKDIFQNWQELIKEYILVLLSTIFFNILSSFILFTEYDEQIDVVSPYQLQLQLIFEITLITF